MELHASLAARNYVVLILPSPFIQFHFPFFITKLCTHSKRSGEIILPQQTFV